MLDLTSELSDAQRQQLLAVAEKCPLHRLMTQGRPRFAPSWRRGDREDARSRFRPASAFSRPADAVARMGHQARGMEIAHWL
jgi:hypothetical protein